MAVIQSSGSLVSTHQQATRPSAFRSLELYSGRVQDYAELYRVQPNLRLVIRFLARNIASLGLKAYRRVSDTDRQSLEAGHPLAAFLKNPVPMSPVPHGRHVWIRGLVEDLALYDLLFVLKMRNEASGKLNGVRIPPPMMTPTGESFLWPEGFVLKGSRGEQSYGAGDVIYLHGHNPSDPKDGLSPAEALRRVLAEEAAAGEWREQYWQGAARMAGVIERPIEAPKWSDPAMARFKEEFHAAYSMHGGEAGRTPVLEEGMHFREAAFSPHDSEYLAGRRLAREECAAAYFIPPVFVGILEHANFANIKEQHVSLYADTLGPWLDWLTEELEAQLVPEFPDVEDVYLEFNIEEKLRGRFEEQASAIQTSTGAPWMTRNEARALRNLPPVDGGDDLVVPLNVLVGGQASPTDSAPPIDGALAIPAGGRKRRGAKALPRYLSGWEALHTQILDGFFRRQSSSVLSKLGRGDELDAAFQADRWNDELRIDLLRPSLAMATELGGEVSSNFGNDFDPSRVEGWLGENARITAEKINGATFDALAVAWDGVARRGTASKRTHPAVVPALEDLGLDLAEDDVETDVVTDQSDPAFLDPARAVFDFALATRVAEIAVSRTTSIGHWSRLEGAKQAGAGSKTWVVHSDNSRHADLDGETVALGDTFSNGAQWPGDPVLGVDETAGCLCSIDFGASAPS